MFNLINGECLEEMAKIPDNSVDLVLCDPPYGLIASEWDKIIPFDKLWEQYNRILKEDGVVLLFGTEPFSTYLRMSNIKNYKYDWLWDKVHAGNPLVAKYKPLNIYENICVFYKKAGRYTPIMEVATDFRIKRNPTENKAGVVNGSLKEFKSAKDYDPTKRYPKNKLVCNNRAGELNSTKRFHSTQKPVEILSYLIKTYTKPGEVVLDNCMGSGSTGVACKLTDRSFIGIEVDKNYFEIAKQRIEEA